MGIVSTYRGCNDGYENDPVYNTHKNMIAQDTQQNMVI